jgi:hypothetical protein
MTKLCNGKGYYIRKEILAMGMKMPKISNCNMAACSYNKEDQCHAIAITVGDMKMPKCDTFLAAQHKGGDPGSVGSVGACKDEECNFNQMFECTAENINVGMHQDHAECDTFTIRQQ